MKLGILVDFHSLYAVPKFKPNPVSGHVLYLKSCKTWHFQNLSAPMILLGQPSWIQIRDGPKPKVWAGSPNECRTFGRTLSECYLLRWNNVFFTGERTERL